MANVQITMDNTLVNFDLSLLKAQLGDLSSAQRKNLERAITEFRLSDEKMVVTEYVNGCVRTSFTHAFADLCKKHGVLI